MSEPYCHNCEFIDEIKRNFIAQQLNNQARIRELRRYATSGFARVFDQAPILLNVNEPDRPGYVDDPATPRGVRLVERQLWRPEGERRPGRGLESVPRPAVESLFLIGSSGSVGHHAASDLDYWVCYQDGALTAREFELFQRKLAVLRDWAKADENTEANFYAVNLADPPRGRVTRLDAAETEGAVAPLLLLEELYRTFLFVAGRPPLWQGLPLSVTESEYRTLTRSLAAGPEAEYVDLGYPSLPTPQQMLAAALWLARTSEADPFKGLLKIVALLDQVESDFTRPPLCDQVKGAVLAAAPDMLPVDPYLMTIDRVIDYGAWRLTPEQLELLRVSAVLKILGGGGGQPVTAPSEGSPKRRLLADWVEKWGWEPARLTRLIDYSHWPEADRLRLDDELLGMLSSVYIRIARYLTRHYPGRVNPQDEELAPLAARLLMRLKGLDSTVETLPSKRHQRRLSRALVLKRDTESRTWKLHVPGLAGLDHHNLIYQHSRVARVAAWLAHNQVLGPKTRLEVQSAEVAPVTVRSLEGLIKTVKEAFPPFDLRHENLDTLWSVGGQGRILLALNLETAPERTELETVDLILRTGWGEMRHYFLPVDQLSLAADKYLKITQAVLKESGDARPENLVFHAPETPEMRIAVNNLRGAMALARRGRARVEDGAKEKLRLDI